MIHPTPGRIVWYRPNARDAERGMDSIPGEPLAAIVAAVVSERSVNLSVYDATGAAHPRMGVWLVQEGEEPPQDDAYAEWMPYQKGQAAKVEQLEQQAKGKAKAAPAGS